MAGTGVFRPFVLLVAAERCEPTDDIDPEIVVTGARGRRPPTGPGGGGLLANFGRAPDARSVGAGEGPGR